MNTSLLESIYNNLQSAVSGVTNSQVFYLTVPNDEYLSDLVVVYSIRNNQNVDTFDTKEANKTYELTVKINHPTTEAILTNKVFIVSKIYDLININSAIKCLSMTDDDLFYDFELKIYTDYLKFDLQYSE